MPNASTMSDAVKLRRLTVSAARECRCTPAQAASNGGMAFDSMAPMTPLKTSPLPAVARLNAVVTLTTARPSGAAMTVSAPLSTTTQFSVFAALMACFNLLFSVISGNRRENSPECGVMTARDKSLTLLTKGRASASL